MVGRCPLEMVQDCHRFEVRSGEETANAADGSR